MIGKLNRWGNFGEIREGWVADILLINGEPLEDISVLRDPESALALIMKGQKERTQNLRLEPLPGAEAAEDDAAPAAAAEEEVKTDV